MIWSTMAWAASLVVADGELEAVPLDPEVGVVVQLPTYVRVVTPADDLEVAPVETGEAGVRHLQVRPRSSTFEGEQITFVLGDGRSVALAFEPSAGADRFLSVKLREEPTEAAQRRAGWHAPERALLAAMFRDDPVRRTVHDEELVFDAYPELQWRLIRTHQGDEGLVGYTFELRNLADSRVELHPEVLSVGWPNRAVFTQVDHEVLVPCAMREVWDPDGVSCRTALRLVVRGAEAGLGSNTPPVRSDAPFVVVPNDKERRR